MADRNLDAEARAAREKLELAVVERDPLKALEACDAVDALFQAGFVLWERPHSSVTEAKPVKFALKKSDALCAECTKYLPLGTLVWWTRGHSGVLCVECHESEAA